MTDRGAEGSQEPFASRIRPGARRWLHLSRSRTLVVFITSLAAILAANLTIATPSKWRGSPAEWVERTRTESPEDRYAMAGGCYAIGGPGGYVVRVPDGYAATAADISKAEPFHFQTTDLGKYLLFDSSSKFVAASEGLLGTAAQSATGSLPGQIVGGVAMEKTDAASTELSRSAANTATGRGASIVSATEPSELSDWTIDGAAPHFFITLPIAGRSVAVENGELILTTGTGSRFTFTLIKGCASFPEVEVNIDGPVIGSANPFQETRGFWDGHGHMMAFEFIGGRVRCGRPWHPYGVAKALVDCPDHHPGGEGAALEMALSGVGPHDTDGWPTFTGWPRNNSLTHEQVYYKWLERSWRGGLRLYVNLLVDNGQLCKSYPFKRNSCNEMEGVALQAQRIRELERYIDAQYGGPGRGWFRIVTDPFTARRVINEGRLAVILGMEVSVPFDCGITLDLVNCDEEKIVKGLDKVYALGVRQMELVNKFDNALSGVTGDTGSTGIVVNQGNLGETGRYWRMQTCPEDADHGHDKQQTNLHDDTGGHEQFTGRDSLFGGVLAVSGRSGAAPVYPSAPHCNVLGLSDLGKLVIQGIAERGMIFDPDHMSALARAQAMDLIESMEYSGVVSSHSWADDTIYPRIHKAGGVIAPHPGSSLSFPDKWRKNKAWADPRFLFGLGYGADTNGFSVQGSARGASAPSPVTYPFTGFGGTTIHKQKSGTRTYDINTDGVAHYGLYPDWMQDVRNIIDNATPGQGDLFFEDMLRGPEAYLQMWERAVGIGPPSCRKAPDLTSEQLSELSVGKSAEEVLHLLGQPFTRMGSEFTYCATGRRKATLTFSSDGSLGSWSIT